MKMLACFVALAMAKVAVAEPVADPEPAVGLVTGLVVQAPANLHVGSWNALDIGFAGMLGLRYRRLTLAAEGEAMTLWPADWAGGAENSNVEGSMQRLGLDARVAVISHDGAGVYLAVSPGVERIHVYGEDAYTRRDLAFGIGIGGSGRGGRRTLRFGGFIELRATFATGEPTPPAVDAVDTTARCSAACVAPASHGIDAGVAFRIGLLFGT
jgi:hypothetical protein